MCFLYFYYFYSFKWSTSNPGILQFNGPNFTNFSELVGGWKGLITWYITTIPQGTLPTYRGVTSATFTSGRRCSALRRSVIVFSLVFARGETAKPSGLYARRRISSLKKVCFGINKSSKISLGPTSFVSIASTELVIGLLCPGGLGKRSLCMVGNKKWAYANGSRRSQAVITPTIKTPLTYGVIRLTRRVTVICCGRKNRPPNRSASTVL